MEFLTTDEIDEIIQALLSEETEWVGTGRRIDNSELIKKLERIKNNPQIYSIHVDTNGVIHTRAGSGDWKIHNNP